MVTPVPGCSRGAKARLPEFQRLEVGYPLSHGVWCWQRDSRASNFCVSALAPRPLWSGHRPRWRSTRSCSNNFHTLYNRARTFPAVVPVVLPRTVSHPEIMSPTSRLSWQCMRSAFRSHPPSTSLTHHSRALRQSSYPSVSRGIYTASRSFKAEPAVAKPPPPTTTKPSTTSSSPAPAPADQPIKLQEEDSTHVDWATSFHGLSVEPFSKEAADVLLAPLDEGDVEVKPDGIIYLPEIKYRRILNKAFGPGGWGLAPRSETIVTDKAVTREYALLAHGR